MPDVTARTVWIVLINAIRDIANPAIDRMSLLDNLNRLQKEIQDSPAHRIMFDEHVTPLVVAKLAVALQQQLANDLASPLNTRARMLFSNLVRAATPLQYDQLQRNPSPILYSGLPQKKLTYVALPPEPKPKIVYVQLPPEETPQEIMQHLKDLKYERVFNDYSEYQAKYSQFKSVMEDKARAGSVFYARDDKMYVQHRDPSNPNRLRELELVVQNNKICVVDQTPMLLTKIVPLGAYLDEVSKVLAEKQMFEQQQQQQQQPNFNNRPEFVIEPQKQERTRVIATTNISMKEQITNLLPNRVIENIADKNSLKSAYITKPCIGCTPDGKHAYVAFEKGGTLQIKEIVLDKQNKLMVKSKWSGKDVALDSYMKQLDYAANITSGSEKLFQSVKPSQNRFEKTLAATDDINKRIDTLVREGKSEKEIEKMCVTPALEKLKEMGFSSDQAKVVQRNVMEHLQIAEVTLSPKK